MTRIEKLRKILEEHQWAKVEGRMVDVQSANAYITVYDALKPSNQEDLNARNLSSAISICWAILSPRDES